MKKETSKKDIEQYLKHTMKCFRDYLFALKDAQENLSPEDFRKFRSLFAERANEMKL